MAANGILRRIKADHLVGDCGLNAELGCLAVGARHQSHATDPGRKTEIILDARGGAGLAAERAAIEHQHRKPLGRRIDRGGEARGSGADNGDIEDAVRIDRPDQADTPRQFGFARIAQQGTVRTQDDRQLPGIDVEALEQRLRLDVGFGIERFVRRAVAGEKAFQPEHVAVFRGADDHRPADAGFEQSDAAQDQRPHHALAKLGFGDHQRAHPLRRKDQNLDWFLYFGVI